MPNPFRNTLRAITRITQGRMAISDADRIKTQPRSFVPKALRTSPNTLRTTPTNIFFTLPSRLSNGIFSRLLPNYILRHPAFQSARSGLMGAFNNTKLALTTEQANNLVLNMANKSAITNHGLRFTQTQREYLDPLESNNKALKKTYINLPDDGWKVVVQPSEEFNFRLMQYYDGENYYHAIKSESEDTDSTIQFVKMSKEEDFAQSITSSNFDESATVDINLKADLFNEINDTKFWNDAANLKSVLLPKFIELTKAITAEENK